MQKIIRDYIVTEIIGETADFDLASDDDLLSSGLVSSMGFFKLIGFLEKEHGVKVAPDEMVIENFITIDAMCNFIGSQKPS